MTEAILCPQVGQDLTEAKVVALHVKLGDPVKRGQIVAEVESEKATFEVEAFAAGVVVELPYQVGETATVLEPLVVLGTGADAAPKKANGTGAAKTDKANGTGSAQHDVVALQPARAQTQGTLRSSPLARRMAQSHGVDVSRVAGTGPHGAVVMRDVEALIGKQAKPAGVSANAAVQSRLNIKTLKDGAGAPVMFIHGFGAEIAAWRQIAMSISLKNPLMALDLPGHGASPDAAQPGFAGLVAEVVASLKGAGSELHLVGHSLGAAVAVAAAQSGLNVKSLTLISPAGLGPTVDGVFVAGFLAAKSEAALAAQMRRLVHDPADLPASMVRATQAAREAGNVAERQGRVAAGIFEGSTQLFSVRSELNDYQGPCRVILGMKDDVIPPADTERALPAHVALHRLDTAGHLPFVEEQGLVARLIADNVRAGG